ncbi:hypothetical protein AMS68_005119 [Peltaster fructicola]|uniref:Uncharacterized protein n=1 Tax=Peltaster fructicola TaxID=286661 RepID=A0A6H0XXV7_9PEZI|nr:hypothetical protein AMS68_005119 [Peltaster fructicola]
MSDTLCPVFCTAKLPIELIDEFFKEANKATQDNCYEAPVGYLVASTTLPEVIEESATICPIDEQALQDNPFLNKTTTEVIDWAQSNLHPECGLLNDQVVILDDRTAQDKTCLLLSLKEHYIIEFANRKTVPGPEEAPDAWIVIRSDFQSSIVTIMTKATGVGGDDHFEPLGREGHDGVLRIRETHAKDG